MLLFSILLYDHNSYTPFSMMLDPLQVYSYSHWCRESHKRKQTLNGKTAEQDKIIPYQTQFKKCLKK